MEGKPGFVVLQYDDGKWYWDDIQTRSLKDFRKLPDTFDPDAKPTKGQTDDEDEKKTYKDEAFGDADPEFGDKKYDDKDSEDFGDEDASDTKESVE